MSEDIRLAAAKYKCQQSHLFFTRFFFKQRQGVKFIINWHHVLVADEIEKVFAGETQNIIFNLPPGSSKTEEVVINTIARGLALNPRARFLHLSYSDDLALLNSSTAKDIVTSEEYQRMWPLKISADSKSKKRWNVEVNGKKAGGVYATSLNGQVTGFRAGWMAPGFHGAIIIDDPLKPEDAYSKTKLEATNRKLLTTVKSRKANPKTPIIIVMQRIAEGDPTGFIMGNGLQMQFKQVVVPAMLSDEKIAELEAKYRDLIDTSVRDENGRFSYWEYKEPIEELTTMERGDGVNQDGGVISRSVFNGQYQQAPISEGGNIIKGKDFIRYKVLPVIKYRKIYVDTAQKTKERNDFSVFQCWGHGVDRKIYLIDQIRGKWEAPELKRRAIAFWNKWHDEIYEEEAWGWLRMMLVEDKSSGTGLIQEIKEEGGIPIEGIERNKDKYTRVQDALPWIESGHVCIPESASYINDYIAEHEAFTSDDTHLHDDQVDPTIDAISDMLSTNNKLKKWEKLGEDNA